jgi:hypothetical protein
MKDLSKINNLYSCISAAMDWVVGSPSMGYIRNTLITTPFT